MMMSFWKKMKYDNGTKFLDGGVREKTSLGSEGSL